MKPHPLALLAAGLLAACTGSSSDTPASSPAPSVPWQDYSHGLQQRIDAEDCPHLQAEFERADENNAAESARTGHNNADLMAYIEWRRQQEACA